MSNQFIDQWIRDHAYAPDDFVLGDHGLSEDQLPPMVALLDVIRPGWTELFSNPLAILPTEYRPCPICQTNCSGCLEDLAAKQDGLRELLSYCVVQEETMLGHFNPPSASDVYGEMATKLAPLLDGEG